MPKWSGKTPTKIHEIELNTSNLCAANCIFCSRPHGVGDTIFMEPATFEELARQLEDVDFDIIQTSGNGETFLNPHYIEYVRTLKARFPNVPRWIYNNFSMLNEERANAIVGERLFDKIHVTIDSLVPWVYERSKNLNFVRTMRNFEYFLAINKETPLTILYNDINVYYDLCKRVLGKRPARDDFTDAELATVKDEFADIQAHFTALAKCDISFCKINPCLWGERRQAPRNETAGCPKINVIENVTWVLPSGDITGCCYDDEQNAFILGNIHETHILDIFYGDKRRQFIEDVKNRTHKDYPCVNPLACSFGGQGVESK